MARIRCWREKLLLVWFTLFAASVAWAWPRSRTPADRTGAARTLLVTGSHGRPAWGVALSAAKPYVHVFSASAVPVALPAAVGAFTASARATVDSPAAAAAVASGSSCAVCNTNTAQFCSLTAASCCNPRDPWCTYLTLDGACLTDGACYQEQCSNFMGSNILCSTCGRGTCTISCFP